MVVQKNSQLLMPSDVSTRVGFFDRFACRAALFASRAPFFAFCVLLVALWLLQGFITILIKGDPKSFLDAQFELEINTTTTIVTFLMVALLQNSQTRDDQATQHKLNAIADGLADMMTCFADEHDLHRDIQELKLAVGLEADESTAHTETHREAHRDETTA